MGDTIDRIPNTIESRRKHPRIPEQGDNYYLETPDLAVIGGELVISGGSFVVLDTSSDEVVLVELDARAAESAISLSGSGTSDVWYDVDGRSVVVGSNPGAPSFRLGSVDLDVETATVGGENPEYTLAALQTDSIKNIVDHVAGTDKDLPTVVNDDAVSGDRIFVGPGTHEVGAVSNFKDDLEIVCAGRHLTTIRRTAPVKIFDALDVDGWSLTGCTLDGNEANVQDTGIPNLSIRGSSSDWDVNSVISRDLYEQDAGGGANHSFSVRPADGNAPSAGTFRECSAINYGDDGWSIIANVGGTPKPTDIDIIDPFIDGSGTTNSTTHTGIELEHGVNSISVRGGRIFGTYGPAIICESTGTDDDANAHIEISGVTIDQETSASGAAGTAIRVAHGSDPSTHSHITLDDLSIRNVQDGVLVTNATGISVDGTAIEAGGTACVQVRGVDTSRFSVSDTVLVGADHAIDAEDASDISLNGVRGYDQTNFPYKLHASLGDVDAVDCVAAGSTNQGWIVACDGTTLSHVRAYNNGSDGFEINADDVVIDVAKAVDNGTYGFDLNGTDIRLSDWEASGNVQQVNTAGATRPLLNGVGQESASAETPTAANWQIGDTVDFTDSGDGSGTGVYQLMPDETWATIA